MIKYLAIGLLLAFSIHTARAQTPLDTAHWQLVNNAGVPNDNAMAWSSTDTGFLLGGTSDFSQTLDSGLSYTQLTLPGAPTSVVDMSWPSQNTGYIAATATSSKGATVPMILKSIDAGANWSPLYPPDSIIINHIYFPTDQVGYASGALLDGSKNYILKTSNGGTTWMNIHEADTLTFGKLNFIDANSGIVFAQQNSNHILYTTNGGSSFQLAAIPDGSSLTSLHWNTDGSWLVASDSSIYRSVDSGVNWTPVVTADTDGTIQTMTMNDSVGFAFRPGAAPVYDTPVVLRTTNFGASWKSGTLPRSAGDRVQPLAASMPSPYVAYLLATDLATSSNVLMKLAFYPVKQNNGSVAIAESGNNQFSAAIQGNSILFQTNSADRARTITVMDILGRDCASVTIPPGSTMSELPMNMLQPGSYFARLGNAIVKLAVW